MKMEQLNDTQLSIIIGGAPPSRTITFQREGIPAIFEILMPPENSGKEFGQQASINASLANNPRAFGPLRMIVTVTKN